MRRRMKDPKAETKAASILREAIRIKQEIKKHHIAKIIKISEVIASAIDAGGKILIFGNGGSASDAQHIAAELVGRFQKERKAYPALALTTNTSVLTALANDYSYDIVFARQVAALAAKGDVAIGISTSGKARNVINGIKEAKRRGLKTVVLTGGSGGELVHLADSSVVVPSTVTARIQEAHITIAHIICELVENRLSR